MNVTAHCNGGPIRRKYQLVDCLKQYAWMTSFESARLIIPASVEYLTGRRLNVVGLDRPAVVMVVHGEMKVR